ncbi:hypothetical protein Patl1_08160 [Pistacia atlantica]|uniref:Uncharacterized protein n=1 Tax=Pistacia atlantica TaxID=434234 RepID=A0ACC1AH92_9ROSI|nr:hypothetical protein Patl1_08160 [Pistacia atlantica]
MGSINNKRIFTPYHHSACTRTHQIGALLLKNLLRISHNGGSLSWPQRGYGSQLSLKIYIYDENEIDGLKSLLYGRDGTISADSCVKGQWGTQVKIHRLLLQSRFRTRKKEEADLFFVPAYVKCVRMMGGLNDKEINQTYVKVLSQMPYFRRSGGRDHIFVFPSGAGAHLFRSWARYINRSIILTPEGDRTDKRDTSAFNTWKDIIIPGNVDDGMTKHGPTLVQPLPLSKRKYLANYLGRAQGKAGRLQLIELANQYPDKLESPDLKFKGLRKTGKDGLFSTPAQCQVLSCSTWGVIMDTSIMGMVSSEQECVPVILSDEAEFPFQNVIDYTQISIKLPSTYIGPQLLDYLASIPDEDIERMIAHGRQIRCLWVYAPESEPCSAMQGILWELQRKVRQFHLSAETFWLHNGSIVNRDLVEFTNWKLPLPLP